MFDADTEPIFFPKSLIKKRRGKQQQKTTVFLGYSSCDFSRMTSGRVSPSDLPDSPGVNVIKILLHRRNKLERLFFESLFFRVWSKVLSNLEKT